MLKLERLNRKAPSAEPFVCRQIHPYPKELLLLLVRLHGPGLCSHAPGSPCRKSCNYILNLALSPWAYRWVSFLHALQQSARNSLRALLEMNARQKSRGRWGGSQGGGQGLNLALHVTFYNISVSLLQQIVIINAMKLFQGFLERGTQSKGKQSESVQIDTQYRKLARMLLGFENLLITSWREQSEAVVSRSLKQPLLHELEGSSK